MEGYREIYADCSPCPNNSQKFTGIELRKDFLLYATVFLYDTTIPSKPLLMGLRRGTSSATPSSESRVIICLLRYPGLTSANAHTSSAFGADSNLLIEGRSWLVTPGYPRHTFEPSKSDLNG